ncbi:type II secretion system F family protein [Ramlibacter sp. 2FC]|uniref:type II secretion system F family protein n=1 Tax=Ramlibacter sp. 2FC TaxID=2502188 RepID=UPI0010F68B43|nr:type II secretion system F family protein [Ramlibacter sp. 2FC]
MNAQTLILALVFLSVAGVTLGVTLWVNRRAAVRDRVDRLDQGDSKVEEDRPAVGREWLARVAQVAGPMAKLSSPKDGWEASSLRVRFMQAGLRDGHWPAIFFGAKTVLALALPAILALSLGLGPQLTTNRNVFLLVLLAGFGYYLPNVVLSRITEQRQRELRESLPDALDMMLVCVEAGLGLDAAMNRAASEIGMRSQALSDELGLVALELRMGVKREHALRNLALRTGVDDVAGFVTMLVQADRFGTNIAQALRVQADTMRVHRQLRAEELAAKIPLKLLFPLIFFIFPSLLLVLLGPAWISIYRVLLPAMGGR